MIGADTVVIKNITIPGTYVDVPAKRGDKVREYQKIRVVFLNRINSDYVSSSVDDRRGA